MEVVNTLDAVAKVIWVATKEVLETGTGAKISYVHTIQKIPEVHLRPEVGGFVQFTGDYSGLMVVNFGGEAAMELYRQSMIFMGMPEEELVNEYTSDEVVDCVGEMINQIIGKTRRLIDEKFGLTATNTRPKAIALNNSIILTIDSRNVSNQCRRLSFKINAKSFHVEISLEKTEFLTLEASKDESIENRGQIDFDSLVEAM